jgi:ankyrin repeat protein
MRLLIMLFVYFRKPEMLTNTSYSWQKANESDLQLEIRGKTEKGATLVFNKPVLLECQKAPDDVHALFEQEVTAIRSEIFSRYCRAGKLTKAQQHLKRGMCDINRRGESGDGWTPLLHACYNGHLPVVEWLVDTMKVDVNQSCAADGFTPMHCASGGGHADTAAYLIDHMASFFVTTNARDTPLSLALQLGKVDALSKMLAPGTNLNYAMNAAHGVRNHNYVGMYNILPPMKVETAKDKARREASTEDTHSQSRPVSQRLSLAGGSTSSKIATPKGR